MFCLGHPCGRWPTAVDAGPPPRLNLLWSWSSDFTGPALQNSDLVVGFVIVSPHKVSTRRQTAACVYVCVCVCVCVCLPRNCVCVSVRMCVCVCVHVHAHARVHACVGSWVSHTDRGQIAHTLFFIVPCCDIPGLGEFQQSSGVPVSCCTMGAALSKHGIPVVPRLCLCKGQGTLQKWCFPAFPFANFPR